MNYYNFLNESFDKVLNEAKQDEINFANVFGQEMLNRFDLYYKRLVEVNSYMNLTAITEPNEVIKKHFIDCLSILKYIPKQGKVIDVGTGAGFPGIPIKIAESYLDITLPNFYTSH